MEDIRVQDLMTGVVEIDSTIQEIYDCGKQLEQEENIHSLVDRIGYLLMHRFEKETEVMFHCQYYNKFQHLIEHDALKDKMANMYNKDDEEESKKRIQEFLTELYNHILFKDTIIAIHRKSV